MGVSKKKGCDWILVSHDPVDSETAWSSLKDIFGFRAPEVQMTEAEAKPEMDGPPQVEANGGGQEEHGVVTLKFEPFILHVQCRDVDSAKLLHTQRYPSIKFVKTYLTLSTNF